MGVHHLLEAHLANSNGFSLRDIAAVRGGHASTYSRQIAACEDLTEHPEWSEALDRLHEKRKTVSPPRIDLTRNDIIETFDLEEPSLHRTFQHLTPFIREDEGQILMGDMPRGVATFRGQREPKYGFEKDEGLALLTLELIWPANDGQGRARIFTGAPNITDADFWAAPEKPKQKLERHPPKKQARKYEDRFARPYDKLTRNGFLTQEEVNAAREFEQLYIGRQAGSDQALWNYLQERTEGDILDTLMAFCVNQRGFEEFEKQKGWAARSGKVVFKVALQQLNHFMKGPNAPSNPLYGSKLERE